MAAELFPAALSDAYLFPILQLVLVGAALMAFLRANIRHLRLSSGFFANPSVKRGDRSMGMLYGAYAALTALFVAIALSAEYAAGYRVLFAVGDTILIAYICLCNGWTRNKLLGFAAQLTHED